MKKILILCSIWLLSLSVPVFAENKSIHPLPIDKAFTLSAGLFGNDTVLLTWQIAPNHHLYRDRFKFHATAPAAAAIGKIILPQGELKEDKVFGKFQVYEQKITLPVPITNSDPADSQFTVSYQGCSGEGYCYPPTTRLVTANFNQRSVTISDPQATSAQEDSYISLLANQNIFLLILAFMGMGVLLAFTPCVLPMIPILSGIIVGHQKTITTSKAFLLSLIYVLSMAITYAIAGVLVSLAGSSVQAFFQNPWVLIAFSMLFVLLALSFFGVYQIKLPAKFEEKISNVSRNHDGGHYLGVAIMGCLATLILSPCVTPALVGVLGYIAHRGNPAIGGIALFSLGFGMGLPLLAVGLAGGKLLPKAGAWMNTIRSIFGVFFIAIAIWIISRIVPGPLSLALWAALLIICAIYMGAFSTIKDQGWAKTWKGLGLTAFIYGILMLTGAAQGNSNPFHPIPSNKAEKSTPIQYTIHNSDEFQQLWTQAKMQNKPILLDFYANWCMSCHEMDQTTFKDPAVKQALSQFVVIRADITENNQPVKKLMQQFGVIAPPTLIFFNHKGQLQPNLTLVGLVSPKELLKNVLVSSGN